MLPVFSYHLHCSVSVDITAQVPADGGVRRTEHPGDDLRQEEQDSRLLPFLAEDQNL